jgi:hypothetical protein
VWLIDRHIVVSTFLIAVIVKPAFGTEDAWAVVVFNTIRSQRPALTASSYPSISHTTSLNLALEPPHTQTKLFARCMQNDC